MRWRADRSCWKPKPARPICLTGWSVPIWRPPVLEQDDPHPALSFCLRMIFSENRFPLFRIMRQKEIDLVHCNRNRQHHDPPHRRAGGPVLRGVAILPDTDEGTARREPGLA